MSFLDRISESAVATSLGGIILGALSTAVLMFKRGLSNSNAVEMVRQDNKHRDEIRERDKAAVEKQFSYLEQIMNEKDKAREQQIAAIQTEFQAGKREIMEKLNSIAENQHSRSSSRRR